jgi:hypothetical protein
MALADRTTIEEILEGHDGYGLCELDAAVLIEEGLEVTYDPSDEEGPSHVAVRGKLTDSVRHKLARCARVIKQPIIPTDH